ncbi:hypothetical protein G6F46_011323 [Rhizopus delemar]|nr:hypothetical protein G6F55_012424 [Rhizopus delemar]KAG1546276.1 hypothetical protein G6F51_004975 [Rhizopus arrhizus]KAG1487726.1 hypothetical protein G6F54_012482 [Rhizopus delemar]KAG1509825.1 hypothetical protein G6F53_007149 [Rhizopus delemar]KAG1516878.1 hypothetical protein G6F52_009348 [Rhizopus delemar]
MNYHAEEPDSVERVELDHLKDSFVKYVRHDSLGQIANTYLANADLYGPMDIRCIELAQLHSRAVDFVKTGRYAVMYQHLMVNSYPDFMQKKDRTSYSSKKILGQIFRLIDAQNYKNYVSCLIEEGSAYDSQFYIRGMVSYINKARELRDHYDVKLAALINHHGVKTETELLTGYVVKWEKKGKGKTVYKQDDNMLKSVRQLKNEWVDEFEREFIGKHKQIDLSKRNEIYAKAAAWYYVTYHPDERKKYGLEYFSFPWTIYKYLCHIKQNSDGLLNALEKCVANLKI